MCVCLLEIKSSGKPNVLSHIPISQVIALGPTRMLWDLSLLADFGWNKQSIFLAALKLDGEAL